VDGLTDAQVAGVLRQACEEWSPGEDPAALLSTPEGNRVLLLDVSAANMAMGVADEELATLARFAASCTEE
jgi:hypothetical protein